jgi:hypothetical protein
VEKGGQPGKGGSRRRVPVVFIAVVEKIYNIFIKYIVFYYEIHLKYCHGCIWITRIFTLNSNRNKIVGKRSMACK